MESGARQTAQSWLLWAGTGRRTTPPSERPDHRAVDVRRQPPAEVGTGRVTADRRRIDRAEGLRRRAVADDDGLLPNRLHIVILVESERHIGAAVEVARRYFLSSLATTDAAAVGVYVRGHWGVENGLHWGLDVAFRQDASRIRRDHAPQNFALVRKLALSRLQAETTFKAGLQRKRRRADRDLEYLRLVLNAGSQAF